MDTLAADLRYALRILRRSPGSTATAVVSLAVGIAAATGLFSIVNAALLNPFPFADANRIVRVDMVDRGRPRGLFVTTRQLVALQHSDVLVGAFASNTWQMTLTGQGLPEAVPTLYVSANGLNVLGVAPLLGRVFNEADGPAGEQPRRVVVLTYRFWQRHFGGGADTRSPVDGAEVSGVRAARRRVRQRRPDPSPCGGAPRPRRELEGVCRGDARLRRLSSVSGGTA